MKEYIMGHPCPECGGTNFYCADCADPEIEALRAIEVLQAVIVIVWARKQHLEHGLRVGILFPLLDCQPEFAEARDVTDGVVAREGHAPGIPSLLGDRATIEHIHYGSSASPPHIPDRLQAVGRLVKPAPVAVAGRQLCNDRIVHWIVILSNRHQVVKLEGYQRIVGLGLELCLRRRRVAGHYYAGCARIGEDCIHVCVYDVLFGLGRQQRVGGVHLALRRPVISSQLGRHLCRRGK